MIMIMTKLTVHSSEMNLLQHEDRVIAVACMRNISNPLALFSGVNVELQNQTSVNLAATPV